MSWLQRYRIRLYIRNSIWIWPALSIVAALISAALLTRFERAMSWRMNINAETARIILSMVAASTFTLVVLVSSAVLVAVQLASAQLTPRIIGLVYRNRYRKLALALFVFTFTFSVGVLVRIEEGTVPLLSGYLAAYGFLLNLALFILFMDGMGKTLRPSSAVRVVALAGREVIESVYPSCLKEDFIPPKPIEIIGDQRLRIVPNMIDGAVLAFDLKGLVSLGERSNCLIELVPEVGDFIAVGDPLFRIYQGGDDLTDVELQNVVAMGQERTLEQDPMFAFRIIVDIASKALSPAINDPTTAVLAIDQIHHLLRNVGKRYLGEGEEKDGAGRVCLIYRTPNWEDFVLLGITEIRHYGRDSIQVQRRLRAMLENLIATLPKRRHPVLSKELTLLTTSSKRVFPDLDDQVLADSGDLQGIGGSYDEIYEQNHEAQASAGN
jgi:uncharacterized membrane protein